jgi:hypothetical protein
MTTSNALPFTVVVKACYNCNFRFKLVLQLQLQRLFLLLASYLHVPSDNVNQCLTVRRSLGASVYLSQKVGVKN